MSMPRALFGVNRRILLSSLASVALCLASLDHGGGSSAGRAASLLDNGATKSSILDFVARVTTQGGPDYVPPDQRIATFDNDGTLWVERPMYVQLAFALDRVKLLAPMHPEWKNKQPFAAALNGDLKALAASGEKGTAELVGGPWSC